MKEKIKYLLFYGSMFYTILVVVLMLISLFSATTTIELYDNENNLVKINQYKEELLKLGDNNCTKVINKMINFYENTSYNGEVELKSIWDYFVNVEDGYLHYVGEVRDNCNLTYEQMQELDFPSKFVNISVNTDKMFQPYYFQYELSLKDKLSREVMEFNTLNLDYSMRKKDELELISTLIELEKKGDEISG